MTLFKRKPRSFDFNPGGTPFLDSQNRHFPLQALTKLLALPLAVILALWRFGQPAILFQHWYRGFDSAPVQYRCLYLTLTGWQDIWPAATPSRCWPMAQGKRTNILAERYGMTRRRV